MYFQTHATVNRAMFTPPESGTIEFPEFLTMMVRKVKAPETHKELIDAFRVFDQQNNGFISITQVRHVLTSMGERLNQTEINELCRVADNGDGHIKYVGGFTVNKLYSRDNTKLLIFTLPHVLFLGLKTIGGNNS